MHRSGTSAVARLIQALGVDVGSNLLPASGGNVHGHFEDYAFIRFHDELIKRFFPQRAPFCEWLPLADGDTPYTEADRAEADSLWKAHKSDGGHAWKDPRTSLFLDLWTQVLPEARIVVCLRHPYHVHRSLLRRGEPFLHVDYSAAITGWTVYNRRLLKTVSALPRSRFIVVDVERAFHESRRLTESLAHFLELPVAPKALEAITAGEFHFEDDCQDALGSFGIYFPEADAIYRQLRQFDLLHPEVFAPAARETVPIRSEETRLIEFEEAHGLRAKAKKMLIRSIAVDRQRIADHYKQLAQITAEKDGLIEDLSRLTSGLKRRLEELENNRAKVSN